MLGHKFRFSQSYLAKLEQESGIVIDYQNSSNLYSVIQKVIPKRSIDLSERYYLISKLAVIKSDLSIFQNDFCLKIDYQTSGYYIWRAFALTLENKILSAYDSLKQVESIITVHDNLIYGDFLLVMLYITNQLGKFDEFDKFFHIATIFLSFCQDISSFTRLGIQYYMSYSSFSRGKKEIASELLEIAFKDATIEPDFFFYSKLLNLKGKISESYGYYEISEKNYYQALSLSRYMDAKTGEMSCLMSLGLLQLNYLNNYKESLFLFQQAIEIAQISKNEMGVIYCEFYTAMTLKKLERLKDAIFLFKKVLKEFEKIDNLRVVLNIYNELGIIKKTLGNFIEAISYYNQANKIARELKLPLQEAISSQNLGLLYMVLGDYEKALRYVKNSKLIYINIKEPEFIVRITITLAEIYRLQGKYLLEMEEYDNLLSDQMLQMTPKEVQAEFYDNYAQHYIQLGKIESAKIAASRSVKIREELGVSLDKAIALHMLGRLHQINNEIEKASKFITEGISLLYKKQLFGDEYQSLVIDLIELKLEQNKFNSAKKILENLKIILKEHNTHLTDQNNAYIQYLEIVMQFQTNEINLNNLKEISQYANKKNYFRLYINAILLSIKHLLKNGELADAITLLEQGMKITKDKKLLPLEIQFELLNALFISNQYDFMEALKICTSLKKKTDMNNLEYYKNKVLETKTLILNTQESFTQLYSTVSQEINLKQEKKYQIIPLKTILSYLDEAARINKQVEKLIQNS